MVCHVTVHDWEIYGLGTKLNQFLALLPYCSALDEEGECCVLDAQRVLWCHLVADKNAA